MQTCPIPAAVPPLQGRAPQEREPPEEIFLSCGQPSVAAGPRQVQRTCTLRKILFADAKSNFPPFGIRGKHEAALNLIGLFLISFMGFMGLIGLIGLIILFSQRDKKILLIEESTRRIFALWKVYKNA